MFIQEIEIGSNYGSISVDVFAPGVDIYSTSINGTYDCDSATLFAAPYVTGIAAMILSIERYCANAPFSGNNLREIIMMSSTQSNNLSGLCRTGGYVDDKKALEIAISYKDNPSYDTIAIHIIKFYHIWDQPFMKNTHGFLEGHLILLINWFVKE